jgi:signal transduction histidine kinase
MLLPYLKEGEKMGKDNKSYLKMKFSGQVIDHLGVEMYQSPIATIGELVSNSWDGDAELVKIYLPETVNDEAVVVIYDDGIGMTREECERLYLNVGRRRRGNNPNEVTKKFGRPVIGRKGIGKFAGFGIAGIIEVETVSEETGERTVFELNLDKLRGDEYVSSKGIKIPILEYSGPDEGMVCNHGTAITLKQLTLDRGLNANQYSRSIARRFLLHKRVANFTILVNDKEIAEAEDLEKIQFVFPRDYNDDEKPEGLREEGEWGVETLSNGQEVMWRIIFYEETIDEEELQGISIFAKDKLAQKPFFFNLAGGLGGQHGQAYISGRVLADYVDSLEEDLIAPERQRINWEKGETIPLEEWGKQRIKQLLKIWQDRRAAKRLKIIENKVAGFSDRLSKLHEHEEKTVKTALSKLASIETLTDKQFEDLGEGLLTAWEQGRLLELIDDISNIDKFTEGDLINVLVEANVLTALNTAEAITTKLKTIGGLKIRIEKGELEGAVRDYIVEQPWLIAPEWETFKKEISVKRLLEEAAKEAGMTGEDWEGRVDLALSSGNQLLIIGFMRPGLTVNYDHVSRIERYVRVIRTKISPVTAGPFEFAVGFLVADRLEKNPTISQKIKDMKGDRIFALDWPTLLGNAVVRWKDFLSIIIERTPEDDRLTALTEFTEG